jgi:hypothetical protein
MADHGSDMRSAGTVQCSNVQPPARPGFRIGLRHCRSANHVANKYHILFFIFLKCS